MKCIARLIVLDELRSMNRADIIKQYKPRQKARGDKIMQCHRCPTVKSNLIVSHPSPPFLHPSLPLLPPLPLLFPSPLAPSVPLPLLPLSRGSLIPCKECIECAKFFCHDCVRLFGNLNKSKDKGMFHISFFYISFLYFFVIILDINFIPFSSSLLGILSRLQNTCPICLGLAKCEKKCCRVAPAGKPFNFLSSLTHHITSQLYWF